METEQIIQSLSYITWVLLGTLALGSFALTWWLRQASDATPGFVGFSALLASLIGFGWLLVEWGLPAPTELAITGDAAFDEPRRGPSPSSPCLPWWPACDPGAAGGSSGSEA